MANSDKNIRIETNKGKSGYPNIAFIGSTNDPIYLYVLDDNTISFEGSTGQLFSVSNSVTSGTIFSVNDISGIPSLRIDADGTVGIAEFSGNVGVGTVNPLYKLDVNGDINAGSGKTLRIGGVRVLDSTTLGSTVVNSSLTGVGTISSGTWNGSAVGVLYGGTGATTAADARTNLSAATAGTNSDITVLNALQRLLVTIPTATGIGITVRGATSQTGNLQQWQNSSATNLSWINSSGTFNFGAVLTHADGRTPGVSVQASNAAGIVVRGYNSDGYPAIEVQNNPGSLMVGLYPSGNILGIGLTITGATASTNTTTGAAIITGGVGIGGSINVGGVSRFTSATASTSSATGGVVFSGGIGVGLTSYFASSVFIQGATASGSTTTGALVITGGVGIGGSLQVTGTIDVADHIKIASQKELRFFNSANTFYTAFKPGSSSANVTFTLPIADGTANQVLYTNGSAALGWTSSIIGTASIASSAAQVNIDASTATRYLVSTVLNTASGSTQLSTGSGITIGNNIITATTFSGNATTATSAGTAGTATNAGSAGTSVTAGSAGTAVNAGSAGSATTATNAGSAGTATNAGSAGTATNAGFAGAATTATSAGTAGTATNAGSAGTSVTAGSATTATNAGSAGTSVTAGSAGTAVNAGLAGTATNAGFSGAATTATSAGTAGTATNAGSAGTAVNAGSATTASNAGFAGAATTATSAGTAGTATNAGSAGTAVNAGSATTATNAGRAEAIRTQSLSGTNFLALFNSDSANATQSLFVGSGISVTATSLVVPDDTRIGNNTQSTNTSSGALIVSGGVGITGNLNVGGNFVLTGDLTINGTTTTVNSTVSTVVDPIITIGTSTGGTVPNSADSKDRGLAFYYFSGTGKTGFFGWDQSASKYAFYTDASISGEVVSGTKATIFADLDGNAGSATTATSAGTAGTATNAGSAGSATTATSAGAAGTATNAGSAGTSVTAGSAGTAVNAGFAGSATTATSAGIAGTATNAGSAGTSVTAGSATTATNAGSAGSATTATSAGTAGTATNAGSAGSATTATNAGTAGTSTSAGTAGTATNAGSAGTSVTAGSAGTATNSANTNVVLDTTSTIYLTGSRSNASIGSTAVYVLSGVSALGNTVTATTFSGNATTATSAGTAGTATNAGSAGTSVSAGTAGTATNAGSAGTSVTAGSAGTAVNAGNAGSATTATNATNVIFSADTTNTTRRLLYSYSGTGSSGVFNTGTLFVNPSTSAVGASIVTATTSLSIRPGIDAASGVSIGNSAGTAYVYFDTTNNRVGINTATPQYDLHIIGELSATNKSFVIDHPTKEGMHLRYGSLEGPENGVYVRGRLKNKNTIELPDYWVNLVDYDSITVTLTPIGRFSELYVENIENNIVYVQDNCLNLINCYFTVYAERIDIPKLLVEY